MARKQSKTGLEKTKRTIEILKTLDEQLREETWHGGIRAVVESALLAFNGAPESHRDAVIEYRGGRIGSGKTPDPETAYQFLVDGPNDGPRRPAED